MKNCSKCKKMKESSEFRKRSASKDGLGITCKTCISKQDKLYYEKNKDKINQKNKENYWSNREHHLEIGRRSKKKNKEKIKERSKIYYENNKEVCHKRSRKWQKNNPEKVVKMMRRWQINNPEKVKRNNRKRRAMKKKVNENYTALDERYTRLIFSGMCFKCKSKEKLCIDHNYPLSKGNALERDNAVLLCRSCNSSKGTKRPEEFYNDLEMYQLECLLYMEY